MKEYTIFAKETTSGTFYIRANSPEEARQKFEEMMLDTNYRDMMEDVEEFSAEIVDSRVIDGTEIETGYIPEMDMTVIIQYTYRNGELITEQIVGFYHGKPDDEMTKEFSTKGTVAVLM